MFSNTVPKIMERTRIVAHFSAQNARAIRQYATPSGQAVSKTVKKAAPIPKPTARKSPSAYQRLSSYNIFIQKFAEERKKTGEKFLLQNATAAYKALPESEKSKLLEQLPELISQRKAIYDEFVSKLSPGEIAEENKIRAGLRKSRIALGKSVRNLAPIVDPNAPTRPLSAFFLYMKDARKDTDLTGMTIAEQSKSLGEKWKQLVEAEKERYIQEAKKDLVAYQEKKKEYYGSS